jgi:hypothetical protein
MVRVLTGPSLCSCPVVSSPANKGTRQCSCGRRLWRWCFFLFYWTKKDHIAVGCGILSLRKAQSKTISVSPISLRPLAEKWTKIKTIMGTQRGYSTQCLNRSGETMPWRSSSHLDLPVLLFRTRSKRRPRRRRCCEKTIPPLVPGACQWGESPQLW